MHQSGTFYYSRYMMPTITCRDIQVIISHTKEFGSMLYTIEFHDIIRQDTLKHMLHQCNINSEIIWDGTLSYGLLTLGTVPKTFRYSIQSQTRQVVSPRTNIANKHCVTIRQLANLTRTFFKLSTLSNKRHVEVNGTLSHSKFIDGILIQIL